MDEEAKRKELEAIGWSFYQNEKGQWGAKKEFSKGLSHHHPHYFFIRGLLARINITELEHRNERNY